MAMDPIRKVEVMLGIPGVHALTAESGPRRVARRDRDVREKRVLPAATVRLSPTADGSSILVCTLRWDRRSAHVAKARVALSSGGLRRLLCRTRRADRGVPREVTASRG